MRKVEHLITAFVITLVLDLLDQPGGNQGGGIFFSNVYFSLILGQAPITANLETTTDVKK